MLSTILLVLAFIIGSLLILTLILKKEYSISSEVIINRSQQKVFDYIKHIRNQEYYSKWIMADPAVKIEYKGTDGTVGFISSWESKLNNVGVGAQEITHIKEGEGYTVEIRFEKPFKGISYANTRAERITADQTKLTTTFDTKTEWPLNIMIPMIKKMLKKDMDENALNLKTILEKQ